MAVLCQFCTQYWTHAAGRAHWNCHLLQHCWWGRAVVSSSPEGHSKVSCCSEWSQLQQTLNSDQLVCCRTREMGEAVAIFAATGRWLSACVALQAVEKMKTEVQMNPDKLITVEWMLLELTSFRATRAVAFKERNLPLHVLINNAGVGGIPFSELTHTCSIVFILYCVQNWQRTAMKLTFRWTTWDHCY